MPYNFLIDTYESDRIKVVSVWSEFADDDLPVQPRPDDLEAAVRERWRESPLARSTGQTGH